MCPLALVADLSYTRVAAGGGLAALLQSDYDNVVSSRNIVSARSLRWSRARRGRKLFLVVATQFRWPAAEGQCDLPAGRGCELHASCRRRSHAALHRRVRATSLRLSGA